MTNRAAIGRLVESHRASNARVFGSVLRGQETEQSDLDFLIEPMPKTSLTDVAAIQIELEYLLGVAVDVLTQKALPVKFHCKILAEAWPI